MIKKINILLIFVASIGGIYFAITKNNNNIVLIIKDCSVILTINALYIIEWLFKVKISDTTNFIYISFVFIAHFLGATVDLYSEVYWFDKFVHFLSGIVSSLGAIYLLVKNKIYKKIFLNVLFILSFAMLAASYWEIFEYLSSYYLGVDPQHVVATGVTDTMGDIIVALMGSVLVSMCYYFEHNEGNNLLIKSFEKLI